MDLGVTGFVVTAMLITGTVTSKRIRVMDELDSMTDELMFGRATKVARYEVARYEFRLS